VASEAGVSVPTVYRHFGTKQDLLSAVYPHLARRAGLGQVAAPESVEDFREMVLSVFSRLHSLGDEARVAMTSPASEEARRTQMPERYAMSRRFAATVMPAASGVDRDRLARVLIILASSSAMQLWLYHLGSSVEEAADDVDWLIRKVLAAPPGKATR
jgi:AcrR family transcriptional regulator